MLPESTFLKMVELMPLIAIDLILENPETDSVLLGFRKNEPAKDYWFVPGGRIYKNEPFTQALARIFQQELGIPYKGSYEIVGVYDHFYNNCFYEPNPYYTNTHYVVIAVRIKLDDSTPIFPDRQHSEFKWMDKRQLLSCDEVHENTKRYFE